MIAPRANPRICFLSTSGELGGAEVCLLDTIEMSRKRHPDWQISLFVPVEGSLARRARELDVQVETVPFPEPLSRLGDSQIVRDTQSRKMASLAFSLIRAIPAFAMCRHSLHRRLSSCIPDVLFANGFKAQILAAMCKPRSSRLVWHTHDYVSSRPVIASLFRRYARRCDSLIANSNSVAEDIRSIVGSGADRPVQVIHNAVDLDRYSSHGECLDLDRLSGMEPAPFGCVRVGLVATMAWWKGHRTYLEAISRLRNSPVRAYLIGGPIYRTSGSENSLVGLRAEAQRLGISDRIGFTGFIPDTAAAMRSLDIVVHASTRPEPFGRVLIEAMACGKPVITTGLGGSAETVAAGAGTMKFWPGEADDLAAAISKLVANPSLRKSIGESARRTVVEHFGRERLADDLELLWKRLALGRQITVEPALTLEKKALASGI